MKIHPKKFLGQNFLINEGIVDKIIDASELTKNDTVLEIGPGKGALTEKLLQHAGRVIAVEKDPELFELLKEKFSAAKNLELINGDILKLNANRFTLNADYKLIANIPYNITGQIFRKFLSPSPLSLRDLLAFSRERSVAGGNPAVLDTVPAKPALDRDRGAGIASSSTPRNDTVDGRPQMLVVMVQKEVGERILGKKDRSILSLLADLYGTSEKVCDVSAGSFYPAPKVTSMVVKLTIGLAMSNSMEREILHLAKIGFSSKRKKLISNLSTGLKIDKKIIGGIFNKLGFSENVRAEELNKDSWLKLAKNI